MSRRNMYRLYNVMSHRTMYRLYDDTYSDYTL